MSIQEEIDKLTKEIEQINLEKVETVKERREARDYKRELQTQVNGLKVCSVDDEQRKLWQTVYDQLQQNHHHQPHRQ